MYVIPSRVFLCWLSELLYIISDVLYGVSGVSITSQYPAGGSSQFQFSNLAIDVGTGKLYAGALNHLIQLDENLTSVMDTTTGPVLDDPTCYLQIGQDPCYSLSSLVPISLKPTNNYNKVLLVDSKHQQLVVCGSVYQGSCETRDIQNLTAVTRYVGTLVASNSPSYSTVAFTGPGPGGDDVLYVGNYIPGINDPFWNSYNFDGVSSRNLTGNKFQLSYKYTSPYYGTFAFLTSSAALVYNVTYIAGFSIQGFSYFLTQQPASYTPGSPPSVSPQIISKIVQVCQNDKNYDSYVEMPIQCKSNGGDYNLVQAATFVHPGSNLASALNISMDDYVLIGVFATTSPSQASSALCMFKLGDIRDKFTQNINACRNNAGLQVGPQFYESSRSCQRNSAVVDNSFCGSTPFYSVSRNSPLVGVIPLVSSLPSLILDNPPVNVTAMAATNEENHTVLFMGTSNGDMIKILLDGISGSIYSTVHLTSSSLPINPDLLFSPNGTHLYVMTSNTIYKVPTSECDHYASCSSCLSAKDPYCGWCTLLNSCRWRSLCSTTNIENNWIPPYYTNDLFGRCPNISDITPSAADVTSESKIILTVHQMPHISSSDFFVCVFGSGSYTSQANITYDQLICQLPRPTPEVSQAVGSLSIDLSLQSSWYRTTFLQTSFTFYNCSSYSSCKSCTSSTWKCQWCIESSLCQTNASFCDTSSNARLVDSNSCPRILTGVNNLLVSEASTAVTVTVNNLPNSTQYFCGLSRELQNIHSILASKSADNSSVICESSEYSSLPYGTQSWNISVMWGPNKYFLDGVYVVTVFDCQTMSSGDCSKCRSFANGPTAIYNCSWCDNGCQTPQNCHTQVSVCPKANITSIGPLVGPLEGGTRLTITGSNIGMSDNQIQIYIGSKICVFNEYTVANRYVCIVPPVTSLIPCKSCPINITITNGVMQNDFVFSYMNISLDSISPSSGPISGGTHVTIHGNDLSIDEGTDVSVNFADQSCDIIRSECNQTQLVFLSPSVNNSGTINKITITIDGTTRQLETTYRYVSNPMITSVTPVSAYKSGGCMITATGQHLDASQSARVDFTSGVDTLSTALPHQRNESSLQFRSPSFPSNSTTVIMTFTLDGFQYNSNLSIIPDPVISPFVDNKLVSTSTLLTIKVRGLLGRSFCTDVRINIGSQNCPLLSGYDGTTDQLLCTLSNVTGGSYSVNVTVGWLNVYLGELIVPTSGASGSTSNSNDAIIWQIIAGVIGGTLLIVIIIIVICYSLRSVIFVANESSHKEDIPIEATPSSNIYTGLNRDIYEEIPENNYYSTDLDGQYSGQYLEITSSNSEVADEDGQTHPLDDKELEHNTNSTNLNDLENCGTYLDVTPTAD